MNEIYTILLSASVGTLVTLITIPILELIKGSIAIRTEIGKGRAQAIIEVFSALERYYSFSFETTHLILRRINSQGTKSVISFDAMKMIEDSEVEFEKLQKAKELISDKKFLLGAMVHQKAMEMQRLCAEINDAVMTEDWDNMDEKKLQNTFDQFEKDVDAIRNEVNAQIRKIY